MRLIYLERNTEGGAAVKFSVSTTEDLWHLHNFIAVGDQVKTKTVRKVVRETATGSGTAEKRVLSLTILVQSVDFDPLGELRLGGINKTESDYVRMNAHHTLSVRVDSGPQDVVVVKEIWDSMCDDRVEEACNQEAKADTVALVMDYGTASVCLVTPTLMVTRQKIETHIPKKLRSGSSRDESITKFFGLVLDALLTHTNFELVKVILVCSPGTVREEFMNFAFEQAQRADAGPLRALLLNKAKLLPVKVSSGHKSAINEALADRIVMQRMEQTKSAEDVRVWQSFHEMMNVDPTRCCYTAQFVFEASKHSAIDALLIIDELLRVPIVKQRRFFIALCETVKDSGGRVCVFSSQHVSGEQLKQLSGIAALLRHPMPELDEMEPDANFLDAVEIDDMIRAHSSGSAS